MDKDAEGYATARWVVLEPSKYSISFDVYTRVGMTTINILDSNYRPIQSLVLDEYGNDAPDSETHYGSISNAVLNAAIRFSNNAYGMPSLENTYLEISNIRLKPIQ